MNRSWQARWWFALCAAGPLMVLQTAAQNSPDPLPLQKLFSVPTNIMPPVAQANPPVFQFRQLLAMNPRERAAYLTNRPPETRERILAKVREYQALDPNERELRLRATELRWYLLPLMREPIANRDARLALVPDDLRGLVKGRLNQWDALSPQSQQEFLENERTLHYFSHVDAANNPPPPPSNQSHWNALPENERQQITAQFNQFFELTPDEKQEALSTLSEAERRQMEKTLQAFDQLPPAQRRQCIHAFTKFAGMTAEERAQFLKNAERWSQLPPKERQAWRDLVKEVPMWPPLPPATTRPPLPPKIQPRPHALVATNRM